ncbi:MAG: hypothetical protein KBC48_02490 [Candidatus Pacebacteria bacterium]|nr:hypothetical protein [Candidatus Paceibacterota bacterium]
MMYLNVTRFDNQFEVHLVGVSKETWEENVDEAAGKIIYHEAVLTHPDYPGEKVIEALYCCPGFHLGDESPGMAFDHLLRSAFMLGLANGAQMERDRIIGNITGLCDV